MCFGSVYVLDETPALVQCMLKSLGQCMRLKRALVQCMLSMRVTVGTVLCVISRYFILNCIAV